MRKSCNNPAGASQPGHVEGAEVLAHLGLVRMWVGRVGRPSGDSDDAFQNGTLGLMRALDRFDASRGNAFSTYASIWIRKEIQSGHLREVDRLGASADSRYELRAVRAAREALEIASGGEPVSLEAIAEATGYSVPKVLRLEGLPTLERFADHPSREVAATTSELDDVLMRMAVRSAVRELPEPECAVVKLHFGLECSPVSLAEAARQLEMPLHHVRAALARALELLTESLVDAVSP